MKSAPSRGRLAEKDLLFGKRPLPRSFYARPGVVVARACIGKLLVHHTAEGIVAGRIVECEAYEGPRDRAAHSWGGRRTKRTEVMFGPPGFAYVFFLYGMHWNFNVVTGSLGEPHAVLIRAVEPVIGRDLMARRRGRDPEDVGLTNGPGKLSAAFAITKEQYGWDLCSSRLVLADGPPAPVRRSKRIGIDYAGVWANKPWRFYDPTSSFVSRIPRR